MDPRQQVAASAKTIVVKVGTRVLTHSDGKLNLERIEGLCQDLEALMQAGRRVVLVSSGAVGAGIGRLGLAGRPTDVGQLQATAAIGQARLMEIYDRFFGKVNRPIAQILLTAEDLNYRARYLNVRNTLLAVQNFGAIPIVNENDTVSVDELVLTFGDNDRLAAQVAALLRAELLVILSDIQGIYDGDPALPESKLLRLIPKLDETVEGYVRDKKSGLSKGGMASKLKAARIVTTAGESVIIAPGHEPRVLTRILAGEEVGTLILPGKKSIVSRKRWIGYSARPKGSIQLDAGACKALIEQGRSLLAIGVTESDGAFAKGDVVQLLDPAGKEIARGLTNYDRVELDRIRGLKSDRIAEVLGRAPYDSVVHRDNLTVVG
ncbi:MAG TPA: glutamate 5-kinase [Pirellulaceae bacterium]|jgi:glutamate 5-kinase|nr:glutamate 5-kinase [Pirellulaceae bacterium]